jgi:hypothetical protein
MKLYVRDEENMRTDMPCHSDSSASLELRIR